MGERPRRCLAFALASVVLSLPLNGSKPPIEVSEAAARAALLYNLSRFVEWPSEIEAHDEPIIIATIGNRDLFVALDALENKMIRGRRIHTRYFASPDKVKECHLLHFDYSLLEEGEVPSCGEATLTVTTRDEGLDSGAIVAVWIEENRLAFSINLDAARDAGFQVNSNMLMLAERVVAVGSSK